MGCLVSHYESDKNSQPKGCFWFEIIPLAQKSHTEKSPDADSPPLSRESNAQIDQIDYNITDLQFYTLAELKSATKNFNEAQILGQGGFGCVYKGYVVDKLDGGDGKIEVAVKKLDPKSLQGHKEWLAEVKVLGIVDHPNLLKLLGYCIEEDGRGMQMLLVYEFMPNKSLEDHLFTKNLKPLSWQTRINVALGAARGLAYLHEVLNPQIIYRDLKSSNILLDNNFSPKLSDFGFARQGPRVGDTHVSTAVVGTVGYAAPEYVQTGRLTAKSDVWSFGMVLLELLTGRMALDRLRPKRERRLIDWVRPYINDSQKLSIIMDQQLKGHYPTKAAEAVALLASKCIARQPKERPKMSEVVQVLEEVLEISGDEEAGFPECDENHSYESLEEGKNSWPRTRKCKHSFWPKFGKMRLTKSA